MFLESEDTLGYTSNTYQLLMFLRTTDPTHLE